MRVKAIIGANFGDEGKGRMTEYFSDKHSIVVRFNGGAQAGHTVVLPDGMRHVFHHLGCGTFKGSPTYLSKFFISNPMLFVREMATLKNFAGIYPEVFVSPFSLVTTPWDMIINELTEMKRGSARHGSCGCGINETIERNESIPINAHLLMAGCIDEAVNRIVDVWIPKRIEELHLDVSDAYNKWINSRVLIENFKRDVGLFLHNIKIKDPEFNRYQQIVFEGAQGLALDQNHENFPHVTRSNTGVRNVKKIIDYFCINGDIEVVYVTRTYATRHGAGPMFHEDNRLSFDDPTNIPNKHQGSMRFGILDIDQMVFEISCDLQGCNYHSSMAITHLDDGPGRFFVDKHVTHLSDYEFCQTVLGLIGFNKAYTSYGPRVDDRVVEEVGE